MKRVINFFLISFFSSTLVKAQNVQTVKGQIIDEASGGTLPGVVVQLLDTNLNLNATTDINGQYKLVGVPVGRRSFQFSMIGYEKQTMFNVIVTTGKELVLNSSMREAITQLNELEVVYDRSKDKTVTNNEMSVVSARSFNIEETSKYAGALGDPSRMAANFAGVVAGNDSRNDIVVRGNSPTGMLWQLEGVNIPNPNHFGSLNSTGGPVSMLNNNTLAKSDFLTSAFAPQYGNATAGVFDLRLRNGNNEKHEFLGQIGFNGFEGGLEGPLGKKNKASYLVNYRYSTLGIFQKMGIDFGTGSATPLYQDVNFKLFFPINNKLKLSVFGIAGNSSVNFLGNEVDTTKTDLYGDENTNTKVKYSTGIFGAYLDCQLSDKTSARFTLARTNTNEQFNGDSISIVTREEFPSGEATFSTKKYAAVIMFLHKINAKNNIQAGLNTDYTSFNLFNKNIIGLSSEKVLIDQENNTTISQAYIQWKKRFTSSFSFVLGIHTQYLSLNKKGVAEPRAALKYMITPKQSISIGYGLHSQAQNTYTYFVQTNSLDGKISNTNINLNFTQSHHSVMTYDLFITDNLHLKLEGYYQSLFNVPVEINRSSFSALNIGADFAPSNVDSLVNKGTGTNFGIEATLERYFSKGFYFLITGSLFESKYKGSDQIERNTAFNTRYVLNALAGKEFALGKKGDVLAFNLRFSTVGGKYLTPLDVAKSELFGTAIYDETLAFSSKQAPYFRCDFKIAYRKEFKNATMEMAIDLQNITNNQNVFRQSYNPRLNKLTTEYQQGFFPVPMFKITF